MSLLGIARIYIHRLRPRAQAEIDWFAHQPTLQAAITKAAMAVNSRGARALGLDAGAKTPATKDSPPEFQVLRPHEIEELCASAPRTPSLSLRRPSRRLRKARVEAARVCFFLP